MDMTAAACGVQGNSLGRRKARRPRQTYTSSYDATCVFARLSMWHPRNVKYVRTTPRKEFLDNIKQKKKK